MKKNTWFYAVLSFMLGAVLFGGGAAYAASGVMAERSNAAVYVDGRLAELEDYNINGNNYVKLRDIGQAVDFNVYWDGSVQIQSGESYTGSAPAGAAAGTPETEAAAAVTKGGAEVNPAVFTDLYTREEYDALRQAILTGGPSDAVVVTPEQFQAMWDVVAALGIWPNYLLKDGGGAQGAIRIEPNFAPAYEEAAAYCQPFVESLDGLSETEKVRQIAFFISDRLTYNAGAYASPSKALASDKVCEGACMSYASACSFLCDMAGIPCVLLHSADHQWNQVYVDGCWKSVDVTGTDVGDNVELRPYLDVVHDNSYMQNAGYVQIHPELTAFVKELKVPGSTIE